MSGRTKTFVKSADTDVTPEASQQAIKDLVRKYGASGFSTSEDYEKGIVMVSFILNTPDGQHVPVQIPVRIQRVYDAMYGHPNDPKRHDKSVLAPRKEQAERTAWRQLHLMVEANLIAVQLGIMSIGEAFLAHTMVVTDGGRSERMSDYLERSGGALGSGARALLASPKGGAE